MARILVVDDAAFMRKMVKDALAAAGHEVVGEAGNGVEAVARFQELKPDLMTLDITDAGEGRPGPPRRHHRQRSLRARRHVLRARSGDEGRPGAEALRQGPRRQAVP